MTLKTLLEEIKLKIPIENEKYFIRKINSSFNRRIKKIFTEAFVRRIYRHMPNKISIILSIPKRKVMAYMFRKTNQDEYNLVKAYDQRSDGDIINVPKKIFINAQSNILSNTSNKNIEESTDVLVHEFIHLMETDKRIPYFRELSKIKEELLERNLLNSKAKKDVMKLIEAIPAIIDGEKSPYGHKIFKLYSKEEFDSFKRIVNKWNIFNKEYLNARLDGIYREQQDSLTKGAYQYQEKLDKL